MHEGHRWAICSPGPCWQEE